ncbi:hypothetical protein [Mycobacteroides chelonae]|jgi:hypothetical protein|uniref:hypothetical protein n=1 Tax=Mycobacteroides chelonae TaxID=1774 RepID=UPI0008AA2227|nr:hypothetical protein [Mycobacteroides chelonae]QQG87909.1 hypothetical protein HBA99_12320 [Mycobacteroides chelonae]QQG92726.1 hypothetical protein HBA97_12320 [Mycobacteroides chelonae]
MSKLMRLTIVTAVATLIPLACTVAPIVSADPIVPNCPDGWWDPVANTCRPAIATTPLSCDNGWWWDPVGNVCRPPVVPPQ